MIETRNFINGKFIKTISKKNIPVLNPANQKIVGNIDEALDDEIDLAYKSAKNAFDKSCYQNWKLKNVEIYLETFLILALKIQSSETFINVFPKFSPFSIPKNVFGAFSIPGTINSLYLSFPSLIHFDMLSKPS